MFYFLKRNCDIKKTNCDNNIHITQMFHLYVSIIMSKNIMLRNTIFINLYMHTVKNQVTYMHKCELKNIIKIQSVHIKKYIYSPIVCTRYYFFFMFLNIQILKYALLHVCHLCFNKVGNFSFN